MNWTAYFPFKQQAKMNVYLLRKTLLLLSIKPLSANPFKASSYLPPILNLPMVSHFFVILLS